MNLTKLAEDLHAKESVDKSDFQRTARILQSIWREEQGFLCQENTLMKKAKQIFEALDY